MASKNDILLQPTTLKFVASTDGSFKPLDVHIVNRSRNIFFFKFLSTAASRYTLSKCKGILNPGDVMKIVIEVIPALKDDLKDYFKVRFYNHPNHIIFDERYISCTVFQRLSALSLVSDDSSCKHDDRARKLSLSREFDSSPTSSYRTDRRLDLSYPRLKVEQKSTSLRSLQKPLLVSDDTRTKCKPQPTLPKSFRCFVAFVNHLIYLLIVISCLIGICLPYLPAPQHNSVDAPYNLPFITWFNLNNDRTSKLCLSSSVRSGIGEQSVLSSEEACANPFCAHDYNDEDSTMSIDDFIGGTRLTVNLLRATTRSIYNAIVDVSPITVISNLSWFGLGSLVMYRLML